VVLTLLVFSYVLGDNVLYRIAVHVLVGAAAAYIAIVATEGVLYPGSGLPSCPGSTYSEGKESSRENALIIALAWSVLSRFCGVLLLFKSRPTWPGWQSRVGVCNRRRRGGGAVGAIAGTVVRWRVTPGKLSVWMPSMDW